MSTEHRPSYDENLLTILRARVERLNGFYVGSLSDEQMIAFNELVKAGWAIRDYNHAGSIMGLAKVKLL